MLLTIQETERKIQTGKTLYLAGDETILKQLPKGSWIGGTIPYFMDTTGGVSSRDKIFVTEQPEGVLETAIRWYDAGNLEKIPEEAPQNGFSIVIIPANSKVHLQYAQDAPDYKGLFFKSIIGWISGVHLDDLGRISPKVFNGATAEMSDQKAIVLHATLPSNRIATVGILNIFKQGHGDTIRFPENGFTAKNCLVNGKERNFADYLLANKVDLKYPLVADYHGESVNVSFQAIDEENQLVKLYAPVFSDVAYKLAEPMDNYIKAFHAKLPSDLGNIGFSCNCILNYLYSELEGKKTGNLIGPITFGEIAYQLLNQTLVYLNIQEI